MKVSEIVSVIKEENATYKRFGLSKERSREISKIVFDSLCEANDVKEESVMSAISCIEGDYTVREIAFVVYCAVKIGANPQTRKMLSLSQMIAKL